VPILSTPPVRDAMAGQGGLSTSWGIWFTQVYNSLTKVFSNSAAAAVQMVPNSVYVADNASQVILTLPAKFNVGDTIQVVGKGSGGWKVAQNAAQSVKGTSSTTTGVGGSISSTARYNSVLLIGITQDTELAIISQTGSLTIV
jgi:hypothetical protein